MTSVLGYVWCRLTQMLVLTHTSLFIFEIEQEWQNWVGWSWARLHCHFFWLRGLRQQHYESLDMFRGEKTVDALVEWAATSLLKLPCILYYGAKGLATHNTHYLSNSFVVEMTDDIQKTGLHKVKGPHHTFDRLPAVLGLCSFCYGALAGAEQHILGDQSAPAVVFVKDPGLEPVIYHGMNCLPSLPLLIL
ncbi:unnamed protein product [Sphagnum troendelagicum]|uniref:Uncharacterized protein n=1 Tax=Sphagnum troendelagicum TaxID=128251 RepID=A0ABP0U096_9BRYO